jgi:hypothetical protein
VAPPCANIIPADIATKRLDATISFRSEFILSSDWTIRPSRGRPLTANDPQERHVGITGGYITVGCRYSRNMHWDPLAQGTNTRDEKIE